MKNPFKYLRPLFIIFMIFLWITLIHWGFKAASFVMSILFILTMHKEIRIAFKELKQVVPKAGIVLTLVIILFSFWLKIDIPVFFPQEFDPYDNKQEFSKIIIQKQDTAQLHHRVWKNYAGNSFETDVVIKKSSLRESIKNHKSIPYGNGALYSFWGGVYSKLMKRDSVNLLSLMVNLDSIRINNRLNKKQFVNMVISFVQDIPYVLIMSGSCNANDYKEKNRLEYLEQKKPCKPYVKFGVQSPVEFLYDLKGDCDTRTLLSYTILNHFNYDVKILNSKIYKHSMLGVNIPTKGKFIKHKGIKYYFWETTAKDWQLGILPHSSRNIDYWRVVI